MLSGPVRPRHGAVSLQWSQHDGLPHPQHGKFSGVVDHREVVNGAATGPAQTRLGPAGWIHDGRQKCSYAADLMHAMLRLQKQARSCSSSLFEQMTK